MKKRSRFSAIWIVPLVLAALTLVGLVAALVGDGWWDAASWIALSVPLAVCLWFGRARRRRR